MPQPHKEYTTPLPKKLLGAIPSGVELTTQARGKFDVIVLFSTKFSEVTKRTPALAKALVPDGRLWLAYPKKASGVPTDLTFENVQQTGLDAGLVDNKSIAVDANWSAVRFVYRLEDR